MYKGRIRSVLVTPEQLRSLNEGELGLVFLRGSYFLLKPEIVEQVRSISPDHVPALDAGGALRHYLFYDMGNSLTGDIINAYH